MPAKLTFSDETAGGTKLNSFTLDCLTESMTVREIIKARIYQEVQDFTQKQKENPHFRGLVEPLDAERTLNGSKIKDRTIDWKAQYEMALQAFQKNGFFMIVGDRQAEDLDEVFEVKVDTEVTFVKLVPLVGG